LTVDAGYAAKSNAEKDNDPASTKKSQKGSKKSKQAKTFDLGAEFNDAPDKKVKLEKMEDANWDDFWDDDYDWTTSALHQQHNSLFLN